MNNPLILHIINRNVTPAESVRVAVGVQNITRSFELVSGPNAGTMLDGHDELDIVGTRYSYDMTIFPAKKDSSAADDYDDIYDIIVNHHQDDGLEIYLSGFGQDVFSVKNGFIESAADTYIGKHSGRQRWQNLSIHIDPVEPQRSAL